MTRSTVALAAAGLAALAAALPARAATYAIDPTHTFVTFEIGHFGTSTNRGRFDRKSGTIQFDREARTGAVDITIDTTSVNSGTPAFDKHLLSPDILKTGEHPTARFVADTMVFAGDKVVEVPGKLTLLGVTQPVTLKATNFNCFQHPMLKREVCGGDFVATFKRSAFGVDYGIKFGQPDEMRVVIQVEAAKQ